ncbi:MAG TPA: hypothetical protein VMF50_15920 [Candidatus Binataceae bacterium]|nr:hypothetical protein [Candidatus Binataceae bacterium]
MTAGDPIKLERLQRDVLAPQLDAFLAATPDSPSRETFAALRAAINTLEVPGELATRLGAITEIALTSGRVRAAHGPGAELALWSLYQKTPQGRDAAASLDALNRALGGLQGQTLEHAGTVARAPGAYALTLKTTGCQLVIRFEPAGVRLESVEFG